VLNGQVAGADLGRPAPSPRPSVAFYDPARSRMTTYVDPAVRPRRVGDDVPPPKRKDPLWAKLCLILGALVMIGSGALIVVPKLVANWAIDDIPQQEIIPDELIGKSIEGDINLLLLGMDERKGQTNQSIRADTIIIVHIPKTHDQVFMISLPRDAEVQIPDFPKTGFRGWRTKINAAFAGGARTKDGRPDNSPEGRRNGAELTIRTINNLVPGGLKFNGVAVINFEGFREILKAIGGVRMCPKVEVRSIHFDKNDKYHTQKVPYYSRKIYKKGCQNFEYWEALDFARQRYGFDNGDYTRQAHQQLLLMAIFKKLASKGTLTDPGKLLKLQKSAGDLLTLDLGKQDIVDWIFTLRSLGPEDLVMIKTNGGRINSIGNGNERLNETTLQLLKAVNEDKVYDFVLKHPDWVTTEKGG
jgi:anionic cell wall polymer biosynthesis LytR-Cps2A-Psr (LCP) family protein